MKKTFSKKNIIRALYIIVPVLFLLLIVGHEFFWRFESTLDLKRQIAIRDSHLKEHLLQIEQKNDSYVDTVQRDLKDPNTTNVVIFLTGSHDTIHSSITGKYFSDFRLIHLSADSSSQIMMIPNSSQGLPAGWSRIIYLKNDSTIVLKEFSGFFIGDIDNDGSEEVNIPDKGWMKLDVSNGDWIPARLKR